MSLIIVVFAALNNALQIALMADYYRKMDTLSAVTYRGLSLGITMLPFLLYSLFNNTTIDSGFYLLIVGAALSAVIANWIQANALHYLSVPIATTLGMGFWSVIIAILAFFTENEVLSLPQISLVIVTLLVSILLGITRNTKNKLKKSNRKLGVLLTFLFGVFIGIASLFVGKASRQYSPYLTSYSWETIIGIFGLTICFIRKPITGHSIAKITLKDFWKILIFGAPTALGTGLYAYSVTNGKMGIISAMFIAATIVFSTILAFLLYKEKLNVKQILLLCAIIGLIITLKIIS